MRSRASVPTFYRLLIVIAMVIAATAGIASLRANGPWFVATTGSDSNDCFALATACQTITAALNKASAGDIIIIADGTYTENLTLNKNITLIGFGQDVTTINGGGVSRIMTVTAGTTAEVSNATLTNGLGEAPLWTAGIYVSGTLRLAQATLTATNNIAIRNDGTFAGRQLRIIHNAEGFWNNGTATFEDSTIEANSLGVRNYGVARLTRSAILSNTNWSSPGAGIANFGMMTLDQSLVRGNSLLDASGAGIYNGGDMVVLNTSIVSNTAYHSPGPGIASPQIFNAWGGGIFNDGFPLGTLVLTNSVLYGNSANNGGDQVKNGGLIMIANSTLSGDNGHHGIENGGWLTLTNATISDMPSGAYMSAGTYMRNSMVTVACIGAPISLGHNIDSGNTCGFMATGDLTNTNPLLGPLQDNGGPTPTYAIPANSPAVNAGDNAACPPTDQRGIARPQAGRCDIGAYEYVFPVNTYLPFVAR